MQHKSAGTIPNRRPLALPLDEIEGHHTKSTLVSFDRRVIGYVLNGSLLPLVIKMSSFCHMLSGSLLSAVVR